MYTNSTIRKFSDLFLGWKAWMHGAFWVVHLLIRSFFSRYHSDEYLVSFWIELTELPIKMVVAYLSIYFIHRYILTFNIGSFLFGMSLAFGLALLLKRLHDWFVTLPVVFQRVDEVLIIEFWDIGDGILQLIYIYPTVVAITAITFTIEWIQKEQLAKDLEIENRKNELRYLKSKIQPHFLFNTLNNLYSLSLDKSEKTPDAILQVSDLLSFMLYQADKPLVLVSKEIELINNLFELESLRTTKPVKFDFDINIEQENARVPPLLLFPLAENAFKYGIGDDIASNIIEFKLKVSQHNIAFSTKNKIQKELKTDNDTEKGFGISTLRKRLNLLFADQYDLQTNESDGYFEARLEVRFSES